MLPKRVVALLGATIGASLLFGLVLPRYFVFALSNSLSHKLFWRLEANALDIGRNDYVVLEHQDNITRYKVKMVKKVGCNEKEILFVDANKNYFCNGAYIGTAKDKSLKGIPVKNFVWNGPIPDGMLLPIGEHKDSYDGRYFGFVAKKDLLSKAEPVFKSTSLH